MQKDFMGMAQGAGAPAEAAPEQLAPEDGMTDADFQEMGLPGGEGPEAMKARILQLLQDMEALEGVQGTELQEINKLVDQLVNDMMEGNEEAIEQNPIMQLLAGVFEEMGIGQEGAEAGMQPADMAGMAGGGGGMPGGGMPPMPGGGI